MPVASPESDSRRIHELRFQKPLYHDFLAKMPGPAMSEELNWLLEACNSVLEIRN
jgi:hypothetical protein